MGVADVLRDIAPALSLLTTLDTQCVRTAGGLHNEVDIDSHMRHLLVMVQRRAFDVARRLVESCVSDLIAFNNVSHNTGDSRIWLELRENWCGVSTRKSAG